MTITTLQQAAQRAREVKAQLESLWADEGVAQLEIFLDPDIIDVLREIKKLSLSFSEEIAALGEEGHQG